MASATKEQLSALHLALAVQFQKIISEGETGVDKETGEIVRTTPSAAHLSTIRQFLKDNNVEVAAGTSKELNSLATSLPFPLSPAQEDAEGLPGKKPH